VTSFPPPTPEHVVVVVFENKDAEQVSGVGDAPFLNALAARGATLSDAHGVAHPSLPNYLALFSGSTHGVKDDFCPQSFTGPNLADQLHLVGRTFTGYSEGLPSAGFTGCLEGRYARKHNPWVAFPDLSPAINQPLTALPSDYANLPTVSIWVPDLCNDMHDCPVKTGDAWAYQYLGPYLDWAESHDSLLIVTCDEDAGTPANHIATIVAGAGVQHGARSDQRIDHYNVLRTIEDMYSLPPLGQAAQAQPVTGIWAPVPTATPTP
jgi:acid phosphatase